MPALHEPENTIATWRNIALHVVVGAVVGYALSLVFIVGRGLPWISRFDWSRHLVSIPIVDADEGMLFMVGLEIFFGGLVALLGGELWSTDAMTSRPWWALRHTPESLRMVRRATWFGGALAAFALVRSWL